MSPTARGASAAVRERIKSGLAAEVALTQQLVRAGSTDIDAFKSAAGALADWANAELAWLKDQSPPPCLQGAWDAYSLGLRDIALGAISAGLVGGEGPLAELEGALSQVRSGQDEVGMAAVLAQLAVCSGEQPSMSSPAAVDVAASYLTLAAQTNQAFRDLRGQKGLGAREQAAGRLSIEEAAAASLSGWLDVSGSLDQLKASMRMVISLLRDAAASTTVEDARSKLRLADAAIFDETGLLSDGMSQRAAAAATRKRFGLPPLAEGDIL
jgi:hypothetical protein